MAAQTSYKQVSSPSHNETMYVEEDLEQFYKNEPILNAKDEPIEKKIRALIQTWDRLCSLATCPSPENLRTLAEYLKSHTLNIVLSATWLKFRDKYYTPLISNIRLCAKQFKNYKGFQTLCVKLALIAEAPWQKPAISRLINSENAAPGDEDYNFFVFEESGYIISKRLQMLCEERCEDLALNLCRAYIHVCKWAVKLGKSMYISEDQRKFITDVYLALLFKQNHIAEMSDMLRSLTVEEGVDMVRRFSLKVHVTRIWQKSSRVVRLAGAIFLTRAVMLPFDITTSTAVAELLDIWLPVYDTDSTKEELIGCLRRIMKIAINSSHMYYIAKKLIDRYGLELRVYNVEIYIQALNTDLNMLEKLKTETELETDKIAALTKQVAQGLLELGNLLADDVNVSRECVLSAFSMDPTDHCLRRVEYMARESGYAVLDTGQWVCQFHPPASPQADLQIICNDCGRYMDQLNINTALQQPNLALSEAFRLNDLGLSQQLRDDLIVIIFCARYQLLSWLQDWNDLYRLCVMYRDDPIRTKNLITELKFVEIDYTPFLLKREELEDYDEVAEESYVTDYVPEPKKRKRNVIRDDTEDEEEEVPSQNKSCPEVLKLLRSFRKDLKRVDRQASTQPTAGPSWMEGSPWIDSANSSSISSPTTSHSIPHSLTGYSQTDLTYRPNMLEMFTSPPGLYSNTVTPLTPTQMYNSNFSEQPVIQTPSTYSSTGQPTDIYPPYDEANPFQNPPDGNVKGGSSLNNGVDINKVVPTDMRNPQSQFQCGDRSGWDRKAGSQVGNTSFELPAAHASSSAPHSGSNQGRWGPSNMDFSQPEQYGPSRAHSDWGARNVNRSQQRASPSTFSQDRWNPDYNNYTPPTQYVTPLETQSWNPETHYPTPSTSHDQTTWNANWNTPQQEYTAPPYRSDLNEWEPDYVPPYPIPPATEKHKTEWESDGSRVPTASSKPFATSQNSSGGTITNSPDSLETSHSPLRPNNHTPPVPAPKCPLSISPSSVSSDSVRDALKRTEGTSVDSENTTSSDVVFVSLEPPTTLNCKKLDTPVPTTTPTNPVNAPRRPNSPLVTNPSAVEVDQAKADPPNDKKVEISAPTSASQDIQKSVDPMNTKRPTHSDICHNVTMDDVNPSKRPASSQDLRKDGTEDVLNAPKRPASEKADAPNQAHHTTKVPNQHVSCEETATTDVPKRPESPREDGAQSLREDDAHSVPGDSSESPREDDSVGSPECGIEDDNTSSLTDCPREDDSQSSQQYDSPASPEWSPCGIENGNTTSDDSLSSYDSRYGKMQANILKRRASAQGCKEETEDLPVRPASSADLYVNSLPSRPSRKPQWRPPLSLKVLTWPDGVQGPLDDADRVSVSSASSRSSTSGDDYATIDAKTTSNSEEEETLAIEASRNKVQAVPLKEEGTHTTRGTEETATASHSNADTTQTSHVAQAGIRLKEEGTHATHSKEDTAKALHSNADTTQTTLASHCKAETTKPSNVKASEDHSMMTTQANHKMTKATNAGYSNALPSKTGDSITKVAKASHNITAAKAGNSNALPSETGDSITKVAKASHNITAAKAGNSNKAPTKASCSQADSTKGSYSNSSPTKGSYSMSESEKISSHADAVPPKRAHISQEFDKLRANATAITIKPVERSITNKLPPDVITIKPIERASMPADRVVTTKPAQPAVTIEPVKRATSTSEVSPTTKSCKCLRKFKPVLLNGTKKSAIAAVLAQLHHACTQRVGWDEDIIEISSTDSEADPLEDVELPSERVDFSRMPSSGRLDVTVGPEHRVMGQSADEVIPVAGNEDQSNGLGDIGCESVRTLLADSPSLCDFPMDEPEYLHVIPDGIYDIKNYQTSNIDYRSDYQTDNSDGGCSSRRDVVVSNNIMEDAVTNDIDFVAECRTKAKAHELNTNSDSSENSDILSSQSIEYLKYKFNLKECSVVLKRLPESLLVTKYKPIREYKKRVVAKPISRPKRLVDSEKSENVQSRRVKRKDENFNSQFYWPLQSKNPRVALSASNTILEDLKKKLLVNTDKMNPRVVLRRLDDSRVRSLLARVPGVSDTQLFRPDNTDRIVNVVQIAGGRATSTVQAPNTQTSTQVSPHIQRIGQPRIDKVEQTAGTETTAATKSTTNTYTISKPAAAQSPTLINILSQQIIRPSPSNNNNTRARPGPLINILSQQTLKTPATTALNKTTTVTSEAQANNPPRLLTTSSDQQQQILNQIVNPNRSAGSMKTVVDGKLIPVTSFPSNRLVKVGTTQAVTAAVTPDSPNADENLRSKKTEPNEISEGLPKFQQAFGKSVYQNNVDSTNSTTNTTNNVENDKSKTIAKSSTVSVQPIQSGVIYTRQMPIGHTITFNPQTRGQVFRIATTNAEQISLVKDTVIHSKMSALLAAALQGKPKNAEITDVESTTESTTATTRVQLTRPTLVQSGRIVKPVLQIPSNVIRNAPQANANANTNTNLSSTTLEQLREFDMVYKQVKERSSTSTPAESIAVSESSESSSPPQRISVTYLNQGGQKINCAPVVVVSTYNNLQPAASPALSVASQGSSSPCVTPAPTPTPVLPKVAAKSSKGKSVKPAPVSTSTPSSSSSSKTSPIPKPQQKPQEDEHTTQRIFDILAEYAEQLRNSPDLNNKPAPRRRSNPPTNPSQNSKRKKTSSSKKPGQCGSLSNDIDMEDPRTVGSEDSSCGVVQLSMQDEEQAPVTPAVTSESNDSTVTTRQQLILTDSTHNQTRNLIIADSSVGEALKIPNTAVLVPGNYIMPVSMVKGGQQIAVVSGGSKILATVPAHSGPNMLLFQSFLNQTRKTNVPTVKYSTIQPISGISSQSLTGVSAQPPVILPPPPHGISTVTLGQPIAIKKIEEAESVNTELLLTISQSRESNCAPTAEDTPQPDSSTGVAPKTEPVDLDETTAMSDHSTEKTFNYQKPHGAAPIATPVIAQATKEEDRAESTAMITLNPLDTKGGTTSPVKVQERVKSVLVTAGSSNGPMLSHSPPQYKQSECGTNSGQSKDAFLRSSGKRSEKAQQVFGRLKKISSSSGQQMSLQRRQAAMERELKLQKSLSEECEDLGVDEPSTSDLFPEALLFDSNNSPSFEQTHRPIMPPQEKEESKLTLFSDDDFMFEPGQYPGNQLYEEVVDARLLPNRQPAPTAEDNTLLQTCTSMSDVTLCSPISPEAYHTNTPPPLNKYMHKYTNKKKTDRMKQADNWPAEVSSSEDTTGSIEPVKCAGSPDICMNKRSDEELSGDGFKVVRLSISKSECSEVHCSKDKHCTMSGRGARKSVKKQCTCCSGAVNIAASRKRSSSHTHTSNPHKKAFPNKKR